MSPQAVVTGTVGDGLMREPQCVRRGDGERRWWLTLAGQDVEHDVAADRAAAERLGTCRLHRLDTVAADGSQDADHLPVAIGVAAKPPPHPLDGDRQRPVLERCTIPQCARLPRQHRQVGPGIIDRLFAPEPAGVFGYDLATLADDDPVRVSVDLDWSPGCFGMNRVFVVIEPDQQCLRHRRRSAWKPSKAPR